MAEGARLESVYTLIAYRGFESLSLRQIRKTGSLKSVFFVFVDERQRVNTVLFRKNKPAMPRVYLHFNLYTSQANTISALGSYALFRNLLVQFD